MNNQDRSTWEEVRSLSDEQAEARAQADPDNPPTDAMFWAGVDLQKPNSRKAPVHVRVTPETPHDL